MQIQPSFLSSNNTLAGPVICQAVMSVISEGSDTFGNLVRLLRNHWKSLQKSLEIIKSGFTPEILNEIKLKMYYKSVYFS